MQEQSIAIVSFTGALKREVMSVKKELEKLDNLSEFGITIKVTGRVSQGDIKIEYKLAKDSYGTAEVVGNNLLSVTEEFLRRQGWTERHMPLLLTVGEQTRSDPDSLAKKDTEIPF